MKINLALEWFLNPDHIPFIVGIKNGYYADVGIELNIITPNEHYDGFNALKKGEIEMAINEPLHLIEQFDENMLSLGNFFETDGGVLLSEQGLQKLLSGQKIKISSPVSNEITNKIAVEILRRYASKNSVVINPLDISIEEVDFYHIKNIKEGYDGAWLAFENFEGVEARLCNMPHILINAQNGDFPNFSALSIFTTKNFYDNNKKTVEDFVAATKKAIAKAKSDKAAAKNAYYDFAKESPTELMDEIIADTLWRFDDFFDSDAKVQKELLEFFRLIKITNLDYEVFKNAFLKG